MALSSMGALKIHFDGLLTQSASAAILAEDPTGHDASRPPSTLGSAQLEDDAALALVASQARDQAQPDLDADAGLNLAASLVADQPVGAEAKAGTGDLVVDPTVWVDPRSAERAWSTIGAVEGLLTFRGNPTRTYYGRGPLPVSPSIQWSVSIGCSQSPVAGEAKEWCGSGWTGQPAVFRSPTAQSPTTQSSATQSSAGSNWWLAFGAYNRSVNFLDPATGAQVLGPYATGDIIKGSVTADPDGYPLLYTGSRDNNFHVVALDRAQPTALWKLSSNAVAPTLWNNDWDGSALVIDDYLFEGGENGRFFVVKLNRAYGADSKVTVDPEIVFSTESWDSELLAAIGDLDVSVENSVAISGNTVYFANSGGLVQGWDISGLAAGKAPTQVLRFWTGDDTDASLVIDSHGMLYAVSQYERGNQRSRDVGQIMKLDPSKPDDPLVWSRGARAGLGSGVWATPALYNDPVKGDTLIVATNEGNLMSLDAATGAPHWEMKLPGPLWSSPVVVDDTLVQADCGGTLHAFDLSTDTSASPPPELWSVYLGGCIESTPAVWDGQIFVGTRMGQFYAIGD